MEDIRDIISDTVNETVAKMKMAGLTKDNRKTAIEKLEELLRNYPTFKAVEGKGVTSKLVAKCDRFKNENYKRRKTCEHP